ncbi:MAG: FAD-dependent oxidoreductase, partial [Myxococcota bacterium]
MASSNKKRIVIIGGGFGGLAAAKKLERADAEVLLIDKRNYHLFQPLLYQVATAGLSPADIASPIRSEFERSWFGSNNVRVMLANAQRVDREHKRVLLEENYIDYDYLVVATGMKNNYFGNEHWEQHAPGLKSLEEAVDIRRRILLAFEAVEYEDDAACVAELLTFVVVGGGPTGVEMAGAIAEIAHDVMTRDFRNVDPSKTRTVLIEGQGRVLSAFSEYSSEEAQRALEKRGVEVIL